MSEAHSQLRWVNYLFLRCQQWLYLSIVQHFWTAAFPSKASPIFGFRNAQSLELEKMTLNDLKCTKIAFILFPLYFPNLLGIFPQNLAKMMIYKSQMVLVFTVDPNSWTN